MPYNKYLANPKISPKARRYISREISKKTRAGYPRKQAIAIAHSKARAKGYKVPMP